MVKSRKEKKSETKALSINHPNSRKALRLAKQVIRQAARNKSKLSHSIKRNIMGEKLLWFQQNLEPGILICTPQMFDELIKKYIARNDEELEQIQIKHSIGQRKGRQHANREDVIIMTKDRELAEYNGPGIEMIDILTPKMLEAFKKWDGNFGKLSLMKMGKFSKTYLEKYVPPPVSKSLMEKQEQLKLNDKESGMDEDEESDKNEDSGMENDDNQETTDNVNDKEIIT